MGKLAVYKYISFMLLVLSVLLAVFTLFGLFGGSVDPAGSTAMAILVYALPWLIIGDIVMLLYWLIRRKWHWLAIPAITLLCCLPYVGTIYQTGLFSDSHTRRSGLNVVTYNVACFGRELTGFKSQNILSQMRSLNVEVLCMQEYLDTSGDKLNSDSYKEYFPYMAQGRSDMVIYSRHPIINQGIIDFGKTNNSGQWADIDAGGHKVRVINVHLETTGINRALHQAAKANAAAGADIAQNRGAIFNAIFGSFTRGMVMRARQADQVARLIKESELPVILCGDFNDVPYSYVYQTMLGDLTDGFKECGKGFMYTMRDGKKQVRIDYIFHDSQIQGDTYTRLDINYSDHFPVFMKLNF